MPSKKSKWVVCREGKGFQIENGEAGRRITHFPPNSVGFVEEESPQEHPGKSVLWIIGLNQKWLVETEFTSELDVKQTGDKKGHKICNRCHRLLPTKKSFAPNQTNKHGVIRRPSCKDCRTDIDKRAPKSSQAKKKEKERPSMGTHFKCPICQKNSIVGVTAKIVADHNHHTGDIRDFICDSCNTGLGRFKDSKDILLNAVEYLKEHNS